MIKAPILFIAVLALALWHTDVRAKISTPDTNFVECCRRSGGGVGSPNPPPPPPIVEAGRRSGDPRPEISP